jgi:hypothetical protein
MTSSGSPKRGDLVGQDCAVGRNQNDLYTSAKGSSRRSRGISHLRRSPRVPNSHVKLCSMSTSKEAQRVTTIS